MPSCDKVPPAAAHIDQQIQVIWRFRSLHRRTEHPYPTNPHRLVLTTGRAKQAAHRRHPTVNFLRIPMCRFDLHEIADEQGKGEYLQGMETRYDTKMLLASTEADQAPDAGHE